MKDAYKKQVLLLLEILPEVAQEEVFALHGDLSLTRNELCFVKKLKRCLISSVK